MQVRATKPGYFGFYREPGEVFQIEKDEDFSDQWMEKADDLSDEEIAANDVVRDRLDSSRQKTIEINSKEMALNYSKEKDEEQAEAQKKTVRGKTKS